MKADTWMPLYISDYLRDTMGLTRDQHGGYLLLLMASWASGGRLPNEPGQLAAIARATPAEWRKLGPVLLRYFQIEGQEIVHKRVVAEHEKAARMAETRRQNGGKGGRPRKLNETGEKPGGFPQDNLNHKLTETPSPSPVSTDTLSDANASSVAGSDVEIAFTAWNATALKLGLRIAKDLTPERRKLIRARLMAAGIDGWLEALIGVERSGHCRGENDRGWKADLDFVCQAKSFQRLREGFYGADAPAASAEPDWQALTVHWTKTGRWPSSMGPPPDQPDTRVPAAHRPRAHAA